MNREDRILNLRQRLDRANGLIGIWEDQLSRAIRNGKAMQFKRLDREIANAKRVAAEIVAELTAALK